MKKIIAILLSFAFVLQICSNLIITGAFYYNRSYIAKNLCINRFVPGSCCRGSCYLKKQLSKEAQKEKTALEKNKETVLFCLASFPVLEEGTLFLSSKRKYPQRETTILFALPQAIFHPPQLRRPFQA